jgi:hypothetical protein
MKNPQTVPDLFNITRDTWLEGARVKARGLLRHRTIITSEDVTNEWPLPKYLHRNTIGSIFKSDMFHAVGYTLAKRPSSHGRVIRLWSYSDRYKPIEEDCDV